MMSWRLLGAVLLLAGGAVHTWLAFDEFGTEDLAAVFFLNGAASAVVAAIIALGRGPFAPVAGMGVSVVSLAAFAVSRIGDGVFGFRGRGLDPVPEGPLTLLFEGAAVVVLGWIVLNTRRQLFATVSRAARG